MDPEGPDPLAVRSALERILSSGGFARNERLSRFLRYLVEEHLQGHDKTVKESLIAVEVFGRRPDYDPKLDSIVRTEAGRLRARLQEYYAGEGRTDTVIIEVPKGGYTPVARFLEAAREQSAPGARRVALAAALAALCLVLIATALRWERPRAPIPIAVLPLDNLSTESGSNYFVDGLTDEIIRNLSFIEGLTVRSRTSSFAFKQQPRTVREAGRQLDVDYVLEGSVLREARHVRINVQLVRVHDDFPLWSEKFDREVTNIFAIQDEISRGIVNSLRLQLGRGRRRYETSVEAYDLYLRARQLSSPSVRSSKQGPAELSPPERLAQSIQFFEQAIAKDPAFAPAYAGLAMTYVIRSVQFPLDHPADELAKIRVSAERAIQLDPLLAEARAALAMFFARDGQWQQAEESFRHAIDLDRHRSSTYADYAYWLLAVQGRHAEALQQLQLAEKVDPLSADVQQTLAVVLIWLGRYDEAATHCQRLATGTQCLARVRSGQERFGEAIQLLANHPAISRNPQTRGFLGYAYARSGRRAEAEAMVAASAHANEQALIFAGLGDKDRTFEALDRMTALGAQRVGLYLHYPELALLRGDPRLATLRHKIGLP